MEYSPTSYTERPHGVPEYRSSSKLKYAPEPADLILSHREKVRRIRFGDKGELECEENPKAR